MRGDRMSPHGGSCLLAITCATVLLAAQAAAQVPGFTVTGRVLEPDGTGIAGAIVEIPGVGQFITADGGNFRLNGVPAGTLTLRASRLGYRATSVQISVRADTSVILRLELAPVRLDSLEVTGRFISITGHVTEAGRDRPVGDADVFLGTGDQTLTDVNGRFRLRRVPMGPPAVVTVRALGYLPAEIAATTENDTTLYVELHEDPIGQRMIAEQIQKLDSRSAATAYGRFVVNRDYLLGKSAWTAWDVVRDETRRRGKRNICFFIDEVQRDLDVLRSYRADEIERIEFTDHGSMIRVYTRRFIGRMLRGRARVDAIVFIKGLGAPVCK